MSSQHMIPRASGEHALQAVQDAVDGAVENVEKNFAHAKECVEEQLVAARSAVDKHFESSREGLHQTIDRTKSIWRRIGASLGRWFDTDVSDVPVSVAEDRVDWLRTLPFIGVHAMCLGVIWVGWSPVAVGVAIAMYFVRMFAITGFYHRYFSHKTFKTSRAMQFVMGIWGACAVQRGPLWWAAHHRHHHKTSDQPEDFHSPVQHHFLWSHMGWIMGRSAFRTDDKQIPDLVKFPELRWLDRFDLFVPVALGGAMFLLGKGLQLWWPELGTSAMQMLVWGFFISTVVLFHGTVTINSLSHIWGKRRYATKDDSRNNWVLAIITLGEGWHNNHHHFPGSTRQGFFWWEFDMTFYGLKLMSWLGLIWDLKPVPPEFKFAHQKSK